MDLKKEIEKARKELDELRRGLNSKRKERTPSRHAQRVLNNDLNRYFKELIVSNEDFKTTFGMNKGDFNYVLKWIELRVSGTSPTAISARDQLMIFLTFF